MRTRESATEKNFYAKRCLRALIALAVAVFVFILVAVLKNRTSVAEWFSRYVSRPIVWLTGHISSLFAVSLYEISIFVAISAVLTLVVLAIIYAANGFATRGLSYIAVLFATIASVGAFYYLTTGFNYERLPAPVPMAEQNEYDAADYAEVADRYYRQLDTLLQTIAIRDGEIIYPYDYDQVVEKILKEMERFDDDAFGGYYSSYTPRPKSMLSSELMSEMSLLGVTFVPLGESNVNTHAPMLDYAATIAHELMHAKGVMREDEANLASYWLLVTAEDDFLKLCGYLELNARGSMWELLDDEGKEYWKSSDCLRKISEVNKALNGYWIEHRTFSKISNFFNDLYLKINGQSGTGSYVESVIPDVDEKPVYDEDGNPVFDEDGNQQVEEIIVYSRAQRMIAKILLG